MSIDDNFLKSLREAVIDELGSIRDFDKIWETLEKNYRSHILELLPSGTSGLSRGLEFFRHICDAFSMSNLRENKRILDIVMEGALVPGDEVIINGVSHIILSRRIGPNFGILYELVSKNGDIIYHEFID